MSLEFMVKVGRLKVEQAEQFRLLYARCRTDADFEQVRKTLESFCLGVYGRNDRYARLMKDHELDL